MKSLNLKGKIFLAPMKDANDIAFRELCHKYGSAMQFTEMIGVNAVCRSNKSILKLAEISNSERPVGIQLMGNSIELTKKAIKILDDRFNPELFDFNFGCSSKDILNQGCGANLLNSPKKIGEIISSMKKSTDKLISAKIRLGTNIKNSNYIKVAKIIEENGADIISVHARYMDENYTSPVHLNAIKEIKKSVNIPVVGNGNVFDEFSAKKMFDETNCDYLMIGRGAIGNPFIFKKINYFLSKFRLLKQKNKNDLFTEYLKLAKKYNISNKQIKLQRNNFLKKNFINN